MVGAAGSEGRKTKGAFGTWVVGTSGSLVGLQAGRTSWADWHPKAAG